QPATDTHASIATIAIRLTGSSAISRLRCLAPDAVRATNVPGRRTQGGLGPSCWRSGGGRSAGAPPRRHADDRTAAGRGGAVGRAPRPAGTQRAGGGGAAGGFGRAPAVPASPGIAIALQSPWVG